MRVGVVVPAWNVAATLADTIRSVVAQSHTDWRMVVVDDGSTDATAAVAGAQDDERLRLLRQANAGVSVARNRGLAALDAACEAVLFLDGDDVLAPDALARLVAALRAAPDAVAAAGAYVVADPGQRSAVASLAGGVRGRGQSSTGGACLTPSRHPPPARGGGERVRRPPSGDVLLALLHRNRFANCGQALIRRAVAVQAGPFRPGLAYGEDWDYLIRVALLGRFAAVPGRAPVLHVHARPGGARRRFAADPAAFQACLEAIFGNPALAGRFSPFWLGWLRGRAEAESHWIIGRELIRHGRHRPGRAWLRRSVCALPSPRRMLLLAAAHALAVLPDSLRGPFVPYPDL